MKDFLQSLVMVVVIVMGIIGCSEAPSVQRTPDWTPAPMLTATPQSLLPTEIPILITPTQLIPTETPAPTMTPTAVSFPTYEGTPLDPANIGIQIHLRDEDQDWLFAHLTGLGVGWVKVQLSWKLYEPAPGEFHAERFAELDAFIDRANDENIQILLGISKAPEWSRPTPEMDGPPTDFPLFETFTAYVANRYQGQVQAYELWNEPNLQREWNGRSLSAADFVTLMQFGVNGIRQFDSEVVVISGAPATTGINDGITAVDDRVYLQQMVANGVGNIVDGIGAHPYGAANPPNSSFASPSTVTTSHNEHPSFFFQDTLNDYALILAQSGVNKPIWVTEFGWGSFETIAPNVPEEVAFMAQISEWQQAEYIARAFELGQFQESVGPMILWNLNFAPLLGEDFSESGYSILGTDGAPRPSYLTLKKALRLEIE